MSVNGVAGPLGKFDIRLVLPGERSAIPCQAMGLKHSFSYLFAMTMYLATTTLSSTTGGGVFTHGTSKTDNRM